MPPVLKDLASSKKFVFVLFISVMVGVLAYLGVLTKPETLGLLGVLWPVYLGSQGLTDVSQKLADAHVFVQTERQALISQDKVALHTMINTLLPDVLKAMNSMQSPSFAREPVTQCVHRGLGYHVRNGAVVFSAAEDRRNIDDAAARRHVGGDSTRQIPGNPN